MTEPSQALSFGSAAAAYDRIRPSYPPEAVRWALGDARRVVDLGAGTGILTRVLIGLGYEAVPVEPDEKMRAQLVAGTPGAGPLTGSAEAIPLPDGSVDGVTAGQAYHWFDPERAHAEVARVLRPGGVFAPIWNTRDESEPWVAAFSRILHPEGEDDETPDFGPRFGPVERATFRHEVRHTPDTLLALVRSRSYYLTGTPQRQRELDDRVRELTTTHPLLAGQADFALPYVTEVYRAFRS